MKINKKVIIVIVLVILLSILITATFYVRDKISRDTSENIEALIFAQEATTLSVEGEEAKKNLIDSLSGKTGSLLVTDSMEIGYLDPPDERIMVFILGTSVEQIEADAISWLLSRGFPREDLCNFPVVFSVDNPDAQTEEKYKLFFFNLPPYCL